MLNACTIYNHMGKDFSFSLLYFWAHPSLPLFLRLSLSLFLSLCFSLYVSLSVSLSLFLSLCLSLCLSISLTCPLSLFLLQFLNRHEPVWPSPLSPRSLPHLCPLSLAV